MGMDVYGKKPRSEAGKYFRASVWTWHPLWDYCCKIAPALCARVKDGHRNDGDGLPNMLAKSLDCGGFEIH